MDNGLVQIGFLALVAFVVLFRLYTTLGRRTGAERPAEPRPQPAQGEMPRVEQGPRPEPAAMTGSPAGEGLMAILRVDPGFEVDHFMSGARAAYELIVQAFARGDREALRPLLTARVYETFAAAIAKREAEGEPGAEFVRLKSAEISEASLEAQMARITVKFEAELAQGATGVRDAREKWTFERQVTSGDPNWRLARVAPA